MPIYLKKGFTHLAVLLLILAASLSVGGYLLVKRANTNGGVLASSTKKPSSCGADGLYAMYNFETASGSTVPDISGCNKTATLADSANIGVDPIILTEGCKVGNKCVLFDGKDDFMSLPNILDLTAGNNNDPIHDFTWSFWIYPKSTRGPQKGCNNDGGSQFCAAFIHRGGWLPDRHMGYLASSYPPGDKMLTRWNNVNILETPTYLTPDQWHHVVLTRYEDYSPPWTEYAHMGIYVDGTRVDQDVFVQDAGFWDEYVNEGQKYLGTYIGGDGSNTGINGYGWAGHVFAWFDNVKVYNRALTKEEICYDYICTPGGLSSGTCEDPYNPPIQVTCQ